MDVEVQSYVGELRDRRTGEGVEVSFSWTQNGDAVCNEEFEVDNDFVSYSDLVRRFGRKAVDEFIIEGRSNAR